MSSAEVLVELRNIFKGTWSERDALKVPATDEVQLGNVGVRLDGTVLYADLTDSTELVDNYKPQFAAEIYKAYLLAACRVIQLRGGEITAFDGDRVMAVFIGESKNTAAAKAALHMNYLVREINQILRQQYPTTTYKLAHTVGVDTGPLFVARTGIRKHNDLVWVGRPANYAAKLCAVADESFPTYITENVYLRLATEAKKGGNPSADMWEKRFWNERNIVVYGSNWYWAI